MNQEIGAIKNENHLILGEVKDKKIMPLAWNGDLMDLIRSDEALAVAGQDRLNPDEVRWAPVVSNPGKIIAIGLNY